MNRKMDARNPLSLYIHVPFCVEKCNYCDFCSFPHVSADVKGRYVAALVRQLEQAADACRGHRVETVYFGGGTPTLLSAREIGQILDTVYARYSVSDGAEVSSECNPGTVEREYLTALRGAGINRLSVGFQSSNAEELRLLGRIHTAEDFLRCMDDARTVGFENLSADVMFGIPAQSPESFRETLRVALSAEPVHISAYGLKIEDGTPFGRARERLLLPDEDAEDEMYRDAVEILAENGLFRYEISNFARPGYESQHNLAYWTQQEYLGFGVAAHSYFAGERFAASRDIGAYLAGKDIVESRETISGEEEMCEYVMLRMRLEQGVERSDFDRRFGVGLFDRLYGEKLARYVAGGFVRRTEGGYAFTTDGFRVSNYILSEIL